MKTRFPLYSKILLFFLLNLVFIGAVFYAVFQYQFRSGLDSLMMAQAGERMLSVSKIIAAELSDSTNWNQVLRRFSEAYDARFYLFMKDGAQEAGEKISLPTEVLSKVKEQGGGMHMGMRMGMGRRGPPEGRGPNRFQTDTNTWLPAVRGGRFSGYNDSEPVSKFLIHSKDPNGYWMGVCLPFSRGESLSPMMLLAMSPSLKGGLFPDLKPWLWLGLGAILCSALFWLPFVHGITHCIRQMTKATEQIAEGCFDAHVQTGRRDELGRLGQAINRMSARLSGFVSGQKRFMGDVAHELCSPIARMQLGLAVLEEQAAEKQKPNVEDIRDDLRQMSDLINELLSFSKASLRAPGLSLKPVFLGALVRQVLDREQVGSDAVKISIQDTLQVLAEPELLGRAVGNIVRNALRYAGASGPVLITAYSATESDTVSLAVADSGPGVPVESLEKIFDPFYRIESSRSRETGGVGLGLAIVKTCVEACQGTVLARNIRPSGLQVEITLKKS